MQKNKTSQKLYFNDNSYKGIPFINLDDGIEFLSKIREDKNMKFSKEIDGNVYTIKRENGTSLTFDFDNNFVKSSNLVKFKQPSYINATFDMREIDPNFYDEEGKIIEDQVRFTKCNDTFEIAPNETTIYLNDYNIDTKKVGGKYLVPFTTFYNIAGHTASACLFNGESLFHVGQSLDESVKDESGKTLKEIYYSFKRQDRSDALAKYNYYEFCRDLDFTYGLREEHGISSFDKFMSDNGLKGLMLTDCKGCYKVFDKLQKTYFADLHSSFTIDSAYSQLTDDEKKEATKDTVVNPSLKTRMTKLIERMQYRVKDNNLGSQSQPGATIVNKTVQQTGDTLIITFDKFFMNDDVDFYYSDKFKNDKKTYADTGDTVAIVSYVNDIVKEDLKKDTPEIKRIIIDLSGNTGGEADTAMFILSWLDSGLMQLEDPCLGGRGATTFLSDVNFDKKCDINDRILSSNFLEKYYTKDIFQGNVYCLTSETSFSCGNYVPAMLKQSGLVKLVGTKSGGGACAVHVSGTADGSGFSFSSNLRLCEVENGSFYHIDKGVEPDYYLDDNEILYGGTKDNDVDRGDRTKIVSYLKNLEK